MNTLNPAQFRILLVGPRVARLQPFFAARGYVADAAATGGEALEALRAAARHLLVVELELVDMLVGDLLQHVHAGHLAGAVILLDDPAKSGLIVSTLVRGIDTYVPTPPDEAFLFRAVERQLLAQWAMAQPVVSVSADARRLTQELELERAKMLALENDVELLRKELAAVRAAAAFPVNTSARMPTSLLDDDSAPALTQRTARAPGPSEFPVSRMGSADVIGEMGSASAEFTAAVPGDQDHDEISRTTPALARRVKNPAAPTDTTRKVKAPLDVPQALSDQEDDFSAPTTQPALASAFRRAAFKGAPEVAGDTVTRSELRIPHVMVTGSSDTSAPIVASTSSSPAPSEDKTSPAGWDIPGETKETGIVSSEDIFAQSRPRMGPEPDVGSAVFEDGSDLFVDLADPVDRTLMMADRPKPHSPLPLGASSESAHGSAVPPPMRKRMIDLKDLGNLGSDDEK